MRGSLGKMASLRWRGGEEAIDEPCFLEGSIPPMALLPVGLWLGCDARG